MANVFNLGYLIRMKIEHIELGQIFQVPYPFNVVLAKHQYSQGRHGVQMGNFFDAIVVQVQKYEGGQADKVFYLRHMVVLQV